MKTTDQIEAIGTACPTVFFRDSGWWCRHSNGRITDIPNDLNAMAEAEKALNLHHAFSSSQHPLVNKYWNALNEVTRPAHRGIHCATAAQRLECVLRVLGLWVEQKELAE